MNCRRPPELTGTELLAHLDGEAGHRTRKHLEACPHCRRRAAELARWQTNLTARIYRFDCPDPLELGEYHLETLDQDRKSAMNQHLAQCPHCSRELAQLRGFLDDLAPSPEPGLLEQVKEQVRVVVARLVSGAGQTAMPGTPAPAYAGLRGGEAGPFVYEADDLQIAIEIHDDAARPGRKAILGLVMGAEPSGDQAHLWRAEQRVAEAPVDDLGNFVIPDLDPGSYQLILSGPQVEVHIGDLQVGATS